MRLIAFSLEGYRRFVAKTSIKVHGDMIALVGPNEAGKSSLLRGLSHLHDRAPFARSELPRRTSAKPRLAWHFQLEAADKAAIAGVFGSESVERVVITKKDDAGRTWAFEPRALKRDRDPRVPLLEELTKWREDAAISHASARGDLDLEQYDDVVAALVDVEDYSEDELDLLQGLLESMRSLHQPEAAHDDDAAGEAAQFSDFWKARERISLLMEAVAQHEGLPSPWRQCVDALTPLLPRIELFGFEDRDLASEYDLDAIADDPPAALMHLAKLAKLDLVALRDEIHAGAIADVATRRNSANRVLLEKFDKSWNQQGIALQVEVQGTILHIQATTPEDKGLSPLEDRSDGLRWFASLLAFADGWAEAPILLVDELETHLHYDAQADLIAVLAKQRFTSKVIYTTHSFGCLPFDLGTGVRVVQPLDTATSRLENGFWKAGAGFSPLLASMGAAALSFTPTRHALLGEGPADAILLPTMMRQAVRRERLAFQIAPGLASVASAAIGGLESEAGRVAFIVDGDAGGLAIREKLIEARVDESRILVLSDPDDPATGFETEDLVDPEVYVQAVNAELRLWNALESEVTVDDVKKPLRSQAVERWCSAAGCSQPDKVAVAQRIVDMAVDRTVIDPTKQPLLAELHARAERSLGLAAAAD